LPIAEFQRNRPLVLDGKVRDAAARIEAVGNRESMSRAGIEARPAGAATIDVAFVRLQFGRGEDRAEEQPRTVRAADQVGVLALPAEPGRLGQRLFHHRSRIDEHLHVAAGARNDLAGDFLEPALHDVVIVSVARIDGDGGAVAQGKDAARIVVRPVVHRQHDDGAHVGP
jgi:hypothetical protein